MSNYLHELSKKSTYSSIEMQYPKIREVLFPRFIEWDGCVLLAQNEQLDLPNKFIPTPYCPDKTGFEAGENHIHFSDYLEKVHKNPLEGLRIALEIMDIWTCRLKKKFPETKFLIILSFDGEDAILRFHTMREDEPFWIDITNLDGFSEGIAILEI